jgi:hypothetical protein
VTAAEAQKRYSSTIEVVTCAATRPNRGAAPYRRHDSRISRRGLGGAARKPLGGAGMTRLVDQDSGVTASLRLCAAYAFGPGSVPELAETCRRAHHIVQSRTGIRSLAARRRTGPLVANA